MKGTTKLKALAGGGLAVVVVLTGWLVRSAWAIPSDPTMYYSGVLEDDSGAVSRTIDMELRLWTDATDVSASAEACVGSYPDTEVTEGHFRIPLDEGCVTAVEDHADLWVELTVGGETLERTRMGAVPYAIEASHAADADEAAHAVDADNADNATEAWRSTRIKDNSLPTNLDINGNLGLERFSRYDSFVLDRTSGNETIDLGSWAFCGLSEVNFTDNGDTDDDGICRVYRSSGGWHLKAARGGGKQTRCRAICFR